MDSELIQPTKVLETAASHGWEAALLAFLVLSIAGFFGWVLRRILDDSQKREERLAMRVTNLENEIRTELFAQLRSSTEVMAKAIAASDRLMAAADKMTIAMEKFETTLLSRPCLLSSLHHESIEMALDAIRDKLDRNNSDKPASNSQSKLP